MDIIELLRDGNGFTTAALIRASKIPRKEVEDALAVGVMLRLRRGLYAAADVPADDRAAVAHGGVITCASLLRAIGVWVTDRDGLHVAVPPTAGGGRIAGAARFHWRQWPGLERASTSRDSVESALLHLITCAEEDDAVVSMDSAMNTGVIEPSALASLRSLAPVGKRHLFDRTDPQAESGLETRMRLAFGRRRLRVRTQVHIREVGRVDMLIGDRLVVETDGDEFHSTRDQRRKDYRRNLRLVKLGYILIRLDYDQVMSEWSETQAVIAEIIRHDEHLWTKSQRRRFTNGG